MKALLIATVLLAGLNNACMLKDIDTCAICALLVCSECRGGYYDMLGSACKTPSTAIANCSYYSDATTCAGCNDGYYLKDKACTALTVANCAKADPLGNCIACKDGKKYDTTTKTCTSTACTAANCNQCSVVLTTETCVRCNSGYKLATSGTTSCVADTTGCQYEALGMCGRCHDGYHMKGLGTCVKNSSGSSVFLMNVLITFFTLLFL